MRVKSKANPTGFVVAALSVLAATGFALAEQPPAEAPAAAAAPNITWDQPANIKAAAEHIGQLQKTRGANSAYQFISACYKTQGLAENYSPNFEACIAQDYMLTQVLAQINSRLPPDQLAKMGSPSAPQLADAMGKRVVAAFAQYKIPATYGDEFKKLVDQHGFPVFLAVVFPNAKQPGNTEDKNSKKSNSKSKTE